MMLTCIININMLTFIFKSVLNIPFSKKNKEHTESNYLIYLKSLNLKNFLKKFFLHVSINKNLDSKQKF